MGIFGALTTAVTGMKAQSYALENVSGNIANSQTTGYKRIDTSFEDMIPDTDPRQQLAGSVTAQSRSTNTVQGDIQSASVSTFMAINGSGFFVVQKPENFEDNTPSFSGVDLYTRRGDFQIDQNGYLVNGAGYYLMGIPIDPTTGNLAGSNPEPMQFQSGFLPAQATSSIDYKLNLPQYPKTQESSSTVPGSELIQPSNFSANPINGAAAAAKIIGVGAGMSADAPAKLVGSAVLTSLAATGGTLEINGQSMTINPLDDLGTIITTINGFTGTTGVTASNDGTDHLKLTSADADSNIVIGPATSSSVLTDLGISTGTTNPTNILTQSMASAGQTLTITVGGNPTLTITFGNGAGQVSTLAELNTQLATLTGGIASVNTSSSPGDITVAAGNTSDTITIGGTATARNFGIRTNTGLPANGTVRASDVTSFTSESIGGGSVTAYDASGSSVNVQLRWAKVDSSTLGAGHTDTWNLFYQSSTTATGTDPAWTNVGVNYTFGANSQLNPPISSTTISNLTVNGVNLGNIQLVHGSAGVTQFADSDGTAEVNILQQNGFAAGQLESVAVSDKGRIVGTYSNGRTVDLAEITLANFTGANSLKRVDGGAFEATADSGQPIYNSSGDIQGSALEGSNTDIADEFTKLIVTQQAYSANTRVISTANTMVQDLLNMLR
jgi:flagellar hook protein FlgE